MSNGTGSAAWRWTARDREADRSIHTVPPLPLAVAAKCHGWALHSRDTHTLFKVSTYVHLSRVRAQLNTSCISQNKGDAPPRPGNPARNRARRRSGERGPIQSLRVVQAMEGYRGGGPVEGYARLHAGTGDNSGYLHKGKLVFEVVVSLLMNSRSGKLGGVYGLSLLQMSARDEGTDATRFRN